MGKPHLFLRVYWPAWSFPTLFRKLLFLNIHRTDSNQTYREFRKSFTAEDSVVNDITIAIIIIITIIIPVPLKRVRTTRSSTHPHSFQVSLPNPRTLSHKSSFIPRTCNLWNVLPSSCFPESYNLPSFKSKINKLDLISLSS